MFSFLASHLPRYFQSRISPPFCLKIPNPEIQIREIPDPEKHTVGPQGKPLLNPDPLPFCLPPHPRSQTVPDPLPLSTPTTQAKGGMVKRTESKLMLVTNIKL